MGTVRQVAIPEPVLPDYGGACLSSVLPAVLDRNTSVPRWLPAPLADAAQVLLLVVDGLGWRQMLALAAHVPSLMEGTGGPITSVAPTTTATALTSITTGSTPAEHGIVGYRMAVPASPPAHGLRRAGTASAREVLDVLHWTTGAGDARRRIPALQLQRRVPFGGLGVPVVTRSEFAMTGFSAAHLSGARLLGWRMPSSLVVESLRLLGEGEPFVYAYYDGLDKVAHEHGLGEHYLSELRAIDGLVGDLAEGLPAGAVLLLTSDHGQVEVGAAAQLPEPELFAMLELISGEGRFRWLHAQPGAADDLAKAAEEIYGEQAWVRTRQQIVEDGWFGGPLEHEVAQRLGDVALVAHQPVAFLDPADTGETRLAGRHGSLTEDEMLVPLLCWPGR